MKRKRETQNHIGPRPHMADEAMTTAWEKAEKAIAKGKGEGALNILRDADPEGMEPTTLRLAGHATWLEAKARNNRHDYRKAASLLRESTKKNPKDKKADRLYNDLLNEMQNRGIRETSFPRLMNDGTPTPAGLFAIFTVFILVIASIQVLQSTSPSNGDVMMEVSWTDRDGVEHEGTIWLRLYDDDTPMHAESFRANVEKGRYNGIPFHRIVDGFMIQGGDFVNQQGTGGYAGAYFGYCSPSMTQTNDCENDETKWVVPAEFGQTHDPGVIAAARSSSVNSHGSQFYLVDSTGAYNLDGSYTAFGIAYAGEIDGESTSGVAVIDQISQVECQGHTGPCSDKEGPRSVHPAIVVQATLLDVESQDPWYQFW